ncbi:MAG: hypothetical protein HY832_00010 [Candidatus Aenigmarchaeota archaeon]|nr:hypothetical protein [Candidatus Aenigmarchaeota archaeon]
MVHDQNYYAIVQELVRRSSEEIRRLRDVEQRLDGLENRLATIEDTALERTKKANAKFSDIETLMKDVNESLLNLKNNVEKINRQINKCARKRDIKEIERMFDLLNPIREEFLTKDELEDELKLRS